MLITYNLSISYCCKKAWNMSYPQTYPHYPQFLINNMQNIKHIFIHTFSALRKMVCTVGKMK